MIQLHTHFLAFEQPDGQAIPCNVDAMSIKLIGAAAHGLDREVVRQAAAAVLFYFRHEQKRTSVTVAEFAAALERVLRGLGFKVPVAGAATGTHAHAPEPKSPTVAEANLAEIANAADKGFELAFFLRLRDEMEHALKRAPQLVRFTGLRGCVKQLAGAQRWCPRCRRLNDQIVDFLRHCLVHEGGTKCALLVD
ncbi:MAG: hypothetical protein EXS29_00760 [Pedosphaera sp.]|nr:hypothetical protein [Pedosphaera sp.]